MFNPKTLILAIAFSTLATASIAQQVSAEQRRACTPDAFRLCSSEIPNVERITACMRQKKAQLSTACAAVFDKPAKTAAN
jgi:hypothetical protein